MKKFVNIWRCREGPDQEGGDEKRWECKEVILVGKHSAIYLIDEKKNSVDLGSVA